MPWLQRLVRIKSEYTQNLMPLSTFGAAIKNTLKLIFKKHVGTQSAQQALTQGNNYGI